MAVNRDSETSFRHASIAAALRARIDSGELAAGAQLPSEAALAREFKVARGTVRQALATLRAEGLIAGGRGRPPAVARPLLAQSFDQMVSFSAWAQQIGRAPSARTLELTRKPADALALEQLGLQSGAAIFEYTRVRLLDEEPVMIEVCTFTEPVGRLLLDFDLDRESVYQALSERGVEVAEARQQISAVAPTAEQAQLLGVSRHQPLLQVQRLAFDRSGTAIEFAHDTYRGDVFAVSIESLVEQPRAAVALSLTAGDGQVDGRFAQAAGDTN